MSNTTKPLKTVYTCWSCCTAQTKQDGQPMRTGIGSVTVCPSCADKAQA